MHELFRLQATENSLNLLAQARAAELSYSSLQNILVGTFSVPENTQKKAIEEKIANNVDSLLQKSVLAWMLPNGDPKSIPFNGIRVSVLGPTFERKQAKNEVKIQVCIKSWLEPLLRIVSDRRNCLGQFTTQNSGTSRGISLIGFSSREPSISLVPYFKVASTNGGSHE